MTLAEATDLLHRQRAGRSSREACERDAASALSLVAAPGPHLVRAVVIGGARVERPAR